MGIIFNTPKIITEDEFYKSFTLLKNHLNKFSAFDGFLYKPVSEELLYAFNLSKDSDRVWTLVNTNDESICKIVSGFHVINSIGFLITQEKYLQEYEIVLL